MNTDNKLGKISFSKYNFSVVHLFLLLTIQTLTFNVKSMIKTTTLIHRIRVFKTASYFLRKKAESSRQFSKKSMMIAEIKVMDAFMGLADVKDEYSPIADFIDNAERVLFEETPQTYFVEEKIIKTTSPEVLSVFLE